MDWITCVIAAVAITLLLLVIPPFQRDKHEAIDRQIAGSKLVSLPGGQVEYAMMGSGPTTILLMHGSAGGYDQGVVLKSLIDSDCFTFVTWSRPGYRRTPLKTGNTMEQQADAGLALLEHLGFREGAVMGISSGGIAAIQFALKHAKQCQGLILVSAISPTPEIHMPPFWMLSVLRLLMSLDMLLWIYIKIFDWRFYDVTHKGIPVRIINDQALVIARSMVRGALPGRTWRDGTLNDIEEYMRPDKPDLSQIKVPTLVVHGTHDINVPFSIGEFSAREISGADFKPALGASHFALATHADQIRLWITDFLT